MQKKSIVSLIVIIIGIAGLVWWGKSMSAIGVNPQTGTRSHIARKLGTLVAEEKFYDFGRISMKNGMVSRVFKVTNTGKEDAKVPSIYTSCMCTRAYVLNADGTKKGPFGMPGHGGLVPKANEIIKAGEALEIEVVFDPNAHGPAGVGLIDRFVYIEDDSGNKIEVEIKATVTP